MQATPEEDHMHNEPSNCKPPPLNPPIHKSPLLNSKCIIGVLVIAFLIAVSVCESGGKHLCHKKPTPAPTKVPTPAPTNSATPTLDPIASVIVIFPVAGVTLDEFNAEKTSYTQAIANTLEVNETQVSVNATELSDIRLLARRRRREEAFKWQLVC